MLRVNSQSEELDARGAGGANIDFFEIYKVLRRQIWIVAAIVALIVGLAAVLVALATPKYTSTAQLLIDSQQMRSLDISQLASSGTGGLMDSAMVDSQVVILKSERIAQAVIKELKILDEPVPPPSFIRSVLGFIFPVAPASDYERERQAINDFSRNLKVSRVGVSYVIEISYVSPDSFRAAQVANQVAEAYIVDQLESKFQATRRASVWLQERIGELRDQALAADKAVVDFKASHDIVDTAQGLISDQQLAQLNTQLIATRTQLAEAQARYDRVQSIMKEGAGLGASDQAVSDVLQNTVIVRLRTQYLDAAKREAEWSKRYGTNHVAVVNLRSEMEGLQRAIFNELNQIAETYKSDLEIAKAREASLVTSADRLIAERRLTSQAQVELRELESTAQSYRTLYDNFLQRFMQATQQQSFPITEARLITDASAPLNPSEPKTGLIIAGGLLLGLLAGGGTAVIRDRRNRTFRTPADVEQYLGLDCLGVLPLMPQPAEPKDGPKKGAFESTSGVLRHVVSDPFSRFSEVLRAVKVSADVSSIGRKTKILGFVSTLPKEGKSTAAANMAQLIAHGGARCLLLDYDLRNPTLTRRITPGAKTGVLELLSGTATLEEVSVVDPVTKLLFIPAAVPGHVFHTNEILASREMRQLIDSLKERVDYIVIDLPPIAPVADALASTHLVDGYVYVLDWSRSNRDLVRTVLNTNQKIYEKVIGCLLNKVDLESLRQLENYGQTYYYYKYQAKYGNDE